MSYSQSKKIKLKDSIAMVFDDHQLFADAFSSILERLNLFKTVQSFTDEEEFMNYVIKSNQTSILVFLDYFIYDKNSLLLFNEIKRINKNSKVVFCSSVQSPTIIENVLSYNPAGFISKSSGMNLVLECVKKVEQGEQFLCPIITEITSKFNSTESVIFTARELDILQYFAKGLSIAETAEKTFLSKHTIIAHRRNMMEKANCKSITELLIYSRKHEFINS